MTYKGKLNCAVGGVLVALVGLGLGVSPAAPICYPGSIIWDGSAKVGCFFEDLPTEAGTNGGCTAWERLDAWNDGTCSACMQDPYYDLVTSGERCELVDLRCLACVNPPSDMVGWWSFDSEYMSDAVDDDWSDNDNYASIFSGATDKATTTCGEVRQALVLDGVDDYAEMADEDSLDLGTSDLTVMAWVKPSSTSGVRVILDKRTVSTSTYKGYHFFLSGSTVGIQLATGTGTSYTYTNYTSSSGAIAADGAWHLVAATVDRDSSTGVHFYVDGVVRGTANPASRTASLSNSAALRIGRRSAGMTGGYFSGALDEVQIYKRALTAAEVLDIYEAGAHGTCY